MAKRTGTFAFDDATAGGSDLRLLDLGSYGGGGGGFARSPLSTAGNGVGRGVAAVDEEPLTWTRRRPLDSLSDWTIVIVSSGGGTTSPSPSQSPSSSLRAGCWPAPAAAFASASAAHGGESCVARNGVVQADSGESSSCSGGGSKRLRLGLDDDDAAMRIIGNDEGGAASPAPIWREDTYHVHKCILGVGPRRSEYFARLFRSEIGALLRTREGADSSVSRIEFLDVPPSAAEAFPVLLHYVYHGFASDAEAVDLVMPASNPSRMVALRYLSSYFGVGGLYGRVTAMLRNAFFARATGVDVIASLLPEADAFHDERLLEEAAATCAAHLACVPVDRLAGWTPAQFERVLQSDRLRCCSEVLSARVAAYLRCHHAHGGCGGSWRRLLDSLTRCKWMPRIDPSEALFFLRMDGAYPPLPQGDDETDQAAAEEGGGGGGIGEGGASPTGANRPATLRERCLVASSQHWEDLAENPDKVDDDADEESHAMMAVGDAGGAAAIFVPPLPTDARTDLLKVALRAAGSAHRGARSDASALRRTLFRLLRCVLEKDWAIAAEVEQREGINFFADAFVNRWLCDSFARANRRRYPDVVVSGAGLKAVNGRYTLAGRRDGVGMYRNGMFSLYRVFGNGKRSWFVSVIGGDDNGDIDFYSSSASGSASPDACSGGPDFGDDLFVGGGRHPPFYYWETIESGQDPPPRIRIQLPNPVENLGDEMMV